MSEENEMDIPSEILEDLQTFHVNLKKMEEILNPLTTTNVNSLDVKIAPLDRARLNLISGYALNSLYWMYLNTLGEDPKQHRLKTELERYKSFMQTVKEITDKAKAPVLDREAAKRFLRNALWKPTAHDGPGTKGLTDGNMPSSIKNEKAVLDTVPMEAGCPSDMSMPSCSKYEERDENKDIHQIPDTKAHKQRIKEELNNKIVQKSTKGMKKKGPQYITLSEIDFSTLSCGLCFKSAIKMKVTKFPVFSTECGHFFCAPCLYKWAKKLSFCPICQNAMLVPLGPPMFLA